MTQKYYEVTCGNVGTVYQGEDGEIAHNAYRECVVLSGENYGRYGGETVTMFVNGEVEKIYSPEDGEATRVEEPRTHEEAVQAFLTVDGVPVRPMGPARVFKPDKAAVLAYTYGSAATALASGDTTWRDRLSYMWLVWGNEVCKALFFFIAVAFMMFALYLWGPLIKSGIGSYLNG